MSKWVRLSKKKSSRNDFFKNQYVARYKNEKISYYRQKVHFINLCPSDPIIGVSIEYNYGDSGHVLTCIFDWHVNHSNYHQNPALNKWLNENNIQVNITITNPTGLIDITYETMIKTVAKFEGLDNIEKLSDYFLNIAEAFGTNIFSDDILKDVTSIVNAINANNENQPVNQYSHTVNDNITSDNTSSMFSNHNNSLFKILRAMVNKNRNATNKETKINDHPYAKKEIKFTDNVTIEEFSEFESALKNGACTNGVTHLGYYTLMMLAVMTANEKVLKYMLIYNGNPILRHNDAEYHYSALDCAERGNYVDAIDMINYSRHPKPEPLFKVKYISTSFDADNVKTEIGFYCAKDKNEKLTTVISTELRKSFARNDPSAKAMIDLAKKTFDKTGEPTLDVEIDENLYKEKQLTEIISDHEGIIGFNLFEIIQSDDSSKIIFYCNISMIAEHYSKLGIMSLLIWRHAYALQLLHPEKTVCVFYIAVSAFSYRLVQNYLHWPLYQPAHIASEIPKLYKAIKLRDYDKDSHSVTLCENQVHVLRQPKTDFYNDFFYRYLLRQPNNTSTGSKGVPVLFFVSGDTYNALKKHCQGLDISDVGDHLIKLAVNLNKLLSGTNTTLPHVTARAQPKFYTEGADFIFWTGKAANSDKMLAISPSKLRSKL